MNNSDVQSLLNNCDAELSHIETLIIGLGGTSSVTPYLNKYSVIRTCGTIEVSFKTLIADYCNKRSKPQIKNFINKKVRENSANPSYERIINILKDFDNNWADNFKTQMRALPDFSTIQSSIQSLVDARNEFAHGGNPTISFSDIKKYFGSSKNIIITLDTVIG